MKLIDCNGEEGGKEWFLITAILFRGRSVFL